MIRGIFHEGSGLGNQLHRYVATRVLALDKGYEFSMIGAECKGKSFMNIDRGVDDYIPYHVEERTGKIVPHTGINHWEEKTNYYNPEFNFISDETIIDGEFQDERYFGHRLNEIDKWLNVEPILWPSNKYGETYWESEPLDDLCVIGFRGGEFYVFPELGLPKEYFEEGIRRMKEINPEMKFEVHTDDKELAQQFFPDFKVIQDMSINWRSMRYAKYAIIANSSFYILPRLLAHNDYFETLTIAPRYWARRNRKEWSMPQNYYKSFEYV